MSVIADLAKLLPSELVKQPLSLFEEVGASLSAEEIVSHFVAYKPLDRGNDKLNNTILIFSLVPVVTCGRW